MRKKVIIFHCLYYALTLGIYMAFFYLSSLMLDLSGESDNLGAVMAVTYGVLFLGTPVIMAVLMRFSLLKWYVDPIAAAEIPLFLYCGMINNQTKRTDELKAAFLLVNNKLSDDGGAGWMFLIGLFVFGLVMSLSFARKKGQSISYRFLSRLLCGAPIPPKAECVIENSAEQTDWKFDFSNLPNWNNRETIPFIYDKYYHIPQSDTLCCIYSIAEVRMGYYLGFLAILKNKDNPQLILNVTEEMSFCDNFSVNQSGNLIFLQPSIYNGAKSAIKHPILIIDIDNRKFSYFKTNNRNSCYKVVELSDHVFGIEADEAQKENDERLNALCKQKIDLHCLNWYDFRELKTLPEML